VVDASYHLTWEQDLAGHFDPEQAVPAWVSRSDSPRGERPTSYVDQSWSSGRPAHGPTRTMVAGIEPASATRSLCTPAGIVRIALHPVHAHD
jgi:hypothetical protein